jgi:hypothetical protein
VKFEGSEIEKAVSLEKPDFKGFEVVLAKDSAEMEVVISASGAIPPQKMIQQKEGEEEDKDD